MIVACVPAWGLHYVDMATRYTLPAIFKALGKRKARIIVHTDQPERFQGGGLDIRPAPRVGGFDGLKIAHLETIESAPEGATIFLGNADIVVSREVFAVAEILFAGQSRVITSTGVRSLIRDEPPPIGGTAAEVFAWAWKNQHPITSDCIWGKGNTIIPTTLFFEQSGSVVVRCFHLHPFLIKKDRELKFKGTIDDDLIARYRTSEIYVARDLEVGFAELSPITKSFRSVGPLTIDRVVQFGRRFIPEHVRNFRHAIRIVGDGPVDCWQADAIQARLL